MSLTTIAIISLTVAVICSITMAVDLFYYPQKMWIMNLVWPLTGLYGGPLALVAYFKIGRNRLSAASRHQRADVKRRKMRSGASKPFWHSVLTGALHCGSGCTLGDLSAASMLIVWPVTLFGSKLYGDWAVEFLAAFFIGIVFQYYAIKPMRNLPAGQAIIAALKADTLSLTCWQIGMYGWMAICDFLIFGHPLQPTTPVYWMMMQIGMILGLATAFPSTGG